MIEDIRNKEEKYKRFSQYSSPFAIIHHIFTTIILVYSFSITKSIQIMKINTIFCT